MIAVLCRLRAAVLARVWDHAQVLLMGAILAPAQRTIAAALRATGLPRCGSFTAITACSVALCGPNWPLAGCCWRCWSPPSRRPVRSSFGIDETLERRCGKRIAAKGIYRDPVRSSHSHFVKASGLRWVCLMLLVPHPVGGSHLGAAGPDGASTFRAV